MPERVMIPEPQENRVWLRVGTLMRGDGEAPLRDAHLVYDKHEIRFVGARAETPLADFLNPGQKAPDADLAEWTLLPGLIEAHAHLFLEGGEIDLSKRAAFLKQSPPALLELAKARLEKLLFYGVTAVRDAGDKDGVGLALTRLYSTTDQAAFPYIDSPGAAIHHKGRYGSFMAEPLEGFPSLEECVADRVRAGADRIKIIPTGIINFEKGAVITAPQMSAEEVIRLAAAARKFKKQIFAHASGDQGIDNVISGEVDTIEHGFFLRDDQLAKLRDKNIAWVPTFAPVHAQVMRAKHFGWSDLVVGNLQRILDGHAKTLIKAHALGVKMIAGSDAGSCAVPHGEGFLTELELMEKAGLPSGAVLKAASGSASEHLAFKEDFGFIKPGYKPRFILTRHSPLETVSNLRKAKTIIFDGRVLESPDNFSASGM
jgi:imidazolonepropionase-like amidohydrolase